jgi:hypothetical protein
VEQPLPTVSPGTRLEDFPSAVEGHPPNPVPAGPLVWFRAAVPLNLVWPSPVDQRVRITGCANPRCGDGHPAGEPFPVAAAHADAFEAAMGPGPSTTFVSGQARAEGRIPGLIRIPAPQENTTDE